MFEENLIYVIFKQTFESHGDFMKIAPLLFCIGLMTFQINAEEFLITEDALLDMAQAENPTLAEMEASFLASKVQAEELKDKFGFEAYGGYNHLETNERAIISFQPVFSNINQYTVGVKKYSKYGLVLDANTSVDQRSGASVAGSDYKDIHTTRMELGLQMDLWKDFWGRTTARQLKNVEDQKKKDELQLSISKKTFQINVRKLYWALVANAEKIKINKRLIATAGRQLKDARRRRANSISDSAEVSRFESLVHQRNGQMLALQYEKSVLEKNLKDLFPNLNSKEIKLSNYNIDKTILEVLTCSQAIGGTTNAPLEHTSYDEVTKLLKGMQERQYKVDQTYDDIDLKFDLKLAQVGVSSDTDNDTDFYGDFDSSLDDIRENDRSAMSAGLMLTIPFGEKRAETTKVKEKLTENKFKANIQNLETQVVTTHSLTQNNVLILRDLVRAQRANSKALNVRVREMRKKYNQARIPEYALIQDQDSLLQSDLGVIDTQLQMVNTILDYFTIFNSFPCSFNRGIK